MEILNEAFVEREVVQRAVYSNNLDLISVDWLETGESWVLTRKSWRGCMKVRGVDDTMFPRLPFPILRKDIIMTLQSSYSTNTIPIFSA